MKKVVLLVGLFAMLSGCVSTKNIQISAADIKQLNPNNVAMTTRDKPDFAAMTAGKAMFAMLGAAAMIAAGNDLVKENQVEDPARYIQAELAKALNTSYGFELSEGSALKVNTDKPAKIATLFPESDLVLDLETINWSFAYFPTDWDNYRVIYSVKLRLFNTKTKSMVAEGFCARVPEEDTTAPSYDELVANKAERLKQELKIAADHCIGEFKSKFLSI
ncbi:YajG family lipoprotein [Paraglaciecola hydrolytica]|uniref:Lipoprotein n=1 Tax=Paraglaciecola hydrolytica TaxID=1799789 RepID=A0A135ZZH3_9ALTE|nr:hypothetical protein [Paraglaciecola hydrolytica]KXI28290.1 hypothetical protein AX660_18130 [Paraglaciecola hydrolytica]